MARGGRAGRTGRTREHGLLSELPPSGLLRATQRLADSVSRKDRWVPALPVGQKAAVLPPRQGRGAGAELRGGGAAGPPDALGAEHDEPVQLVQEGALAAAALPLRLLHDQLRVHLRHKGHVRHSTGQGKAQGRNATRDSDFTRNTQSSSFLKS